MFTIVVRSLNGVRETYELSLDSPISSIIKQPKSYRYMYNRKRLNSHCSNCQNDTILSDFIVESDPQPIDILKLLMCGGPKVEHYIHPEISKKQLIRNDSYFCKNCTINHINVIGRPIDNLLKINFKNLLDNNGYFLMFDTIFPSITLQNVLLNSGDWYILTGDSSRDVDIVFKINTNSDSVILRIDTRKVLLGNGVEQDIKPDTRCKEIIEYNIKIIDWNLKNGKYFDRDKQIRKELLVLQSCYKFPKDVCVYIGRFLI